jgi:RNA polymerase sigma-70 factor (ECF subfamily)
MPSPDPAVSDDAVHLRRTIARLSADDQEALRLVYWERLSCREIGRVLGCSEKAVGIRLSRARQRLARLLVDIPDAPIVPSPAREALP